MTRLTRYPTAVLLALGVMGVLSAPAHADTLTLCYSISCDAVPVSDPGVAGAFCGNAGFALGQQTADQGVFICDADAASNVGAAPGYVLVGAAFGGRFIGIVWYPS